MCTLLRRGGLLPPHGGGFHFREFFIMIRHVFLIGALLLAMTPANDATAQVVAVALDLDFNDPADVNSGGKFTVVASTFGGGTQGISNLNLNNISDANFGSFLVPSNIFQIAQSSATGNILSLQTGSDLALLAMGLAGLVTKKTRSVR